MALISATLKCLLDDMYVVQLQMLIAMLALSVASCEENLSFLANLSDINDHYAPSSKKHNADKLMHRFLKDNFNSTPGNVVG